MRASRSGKLAALIRALIRDESSVDALLRVACDDDAASLDARAPEYARALLAAELGSTKHALNNSRDEVRYNAFQCLQYMASWLLGDGCVALPTTIGDGVAVRVMDDLATTERSRWEVWLELHHGRLTLSDVLDAIAHEMAVIRANDTTRHPVLRCDRNFFLDF